ncbi:FecCD family ABC transporter permease [Roseibium sp.]|uniref:FecCD family ABC transporter permease n=1 Tax=Roseibium sp. TaxID=1936156 RepID=UPI003B50FA3E
MQRRLVFLSTMAFLLPVIAGVHLFLGFNPTDLPQLLFALPGSDAQSLEEAVLLYQRVPRTLIALYVGGVTAVCGFVLQSLVSNPLASPTTLGVNAGAALFLVAGVLLFNLDTKLQGAAALVGALSGFLASLAVAKAAGRRNDPRGLSLILSGALVTMFFTGLTNALLLSDPARRSDLLSWIVGTINHAYADRLALFWWVGVIAILMLLVLARPLTLILFGAEKAASTGVNVPIVSGLAILAAVLGAGSAVAICGPIGFVGLVVPHIVRPLVGNNLRISLPAAFLTGAMVCIMADLIGREALYPFSLSTGLLTDLVGGVVFILIIKRFYLSSGAQQGVA